MSELGTSSADGEALAALEGLASALDRNASDQRRVSGRIRYLREGRARGRTWGALVEAEPKPGALNLTANMARRLSEASAQLRRALARALRSEGATVSAIARQLGVSHQRVSTLLGARSPVEPITAKGAAAAD